ncbi:2-hydroxyacid dehydrogenase [Sansalvadorimonas sp. 2012CJ34-2]|uniref:2-hydroxyacid dehydrogenase n=1 Tax=Parendozoicomonas callyspongiae TaxID=2942213 RepID=A0ABT0PI23_9GAMM|nr:2-hydroxyacid dehydrogenase [Sansalvadorimonas sp. 2012CJ34-2]MCL6270397.1 2-hydroxyacid dehydrogenase [Sansalvadorimonas sp. 2012CJ34-2]
MKTLFFSYQDYERPVFAEALSQIDSQSSQQFSWQEAHLTPATAALADGYDAVCAFVNDDLSKEVLEILAEKGVKLVALRCAGFNNVDIPAAEKLGITVVRVPAYSPEAVAEHAITMIMALNRKIHKSWSRVREGNFHLHGLLGFNLYGRVAGLIGLGRIGLALARILQGFGVTVVGYDPGMSDNQIQPFNITPVSLKEIYKTSDIISLHCPLTMHTYHMINDCSISMMQPGVMLINTSRGALIDTPAVIKGLKSGQVGYLGIDVYEQEGDLFFQDLSEEVIQDDVFQRLLTFPNVLVTGHQGFFTREALQAIAGITINNIIEFEQTDQCKNSVDSSCLR